MKETRSYMRAAGPDDTNTLHVSIFYTVLQAGAPRYPAFSHHLGCGDAGRIKTQLTPASKQPEVQSATLFPAFMIVNGAYLRDGNRVDRFRLLQGLELLFASRTLSIASAHRYASVASFS
jgi:hypothetical protein